MVITSTERAETVFLRTTVNCLSQNRLDLLFTYFICAIDTSMYRTQKVANLFWNWITKRLERPEEAPQAIELLKILKQAGFDFDYIFPTAYDRPNIEALTYDPEARDLLEQVLDGPLHALMKAIHNGDVAEVQTNLLRDDFDIEQLHNRLTCHTLVKALSHVMRHFPIEDLMKIIKSLKIAGLSLVSMEKHHHARIEQVNHYFSSYSNEVAAILCGLCQSDKYFEQSHAILDNQDFAALKRLLDESRSAERDFDELLQGMYEWTRKKLTAKSDNFEDHVIALLFFLLEEGIAIRSSHSESFYFESLVPSSDYPILHILLMHMRTKGSSGFSLAQAMNLANQKTALAEIQEAIFSLNLKKVTEIARKLGRIKDLDVKRLHATKITTDLYKLAMAARPYEFQNVQKALLEGGFNFTAFGITPEELFTDLLQVGHYSTAIHELFFELLYPRGQSFRALHNKECLKQAMKTVVERTAPQDLEESASSPEEDLIAAVRSLDTEKIATLLVLEKVTPQSVVNANRYDALLTALFDVMQKHGSVGIVINLVTLFVLYGFTCGGLTEDYKRSFFLVLGEGNAFSGWTELLKELVGGYDKPLPDLIDDIFENSVCRHILKLYPGVKVQKRRFIKPKYPPKMDTSSEFYIKNLSGLSPTEEHYRAYTKALETMIKDLVECPEKKLRCYEEEVASAIKAVVPLRPLEISEVDRMQQVNLRMYVTEENSDEIRRRLDALLKEQISLTKETVCQFEQKVAAFKQDAINERKKEEVEKPLRRTKEKPLEWTVKPKKTKPLPKLKEKPPVQKLVEAPPTPLQSASIRAPVLTGPIEVIARSLDLRIPMPKLFVPPTGSDKADKYRHLKEILLVMSSHLNLPEPDESSRLNRRLALLYTLFKFNDFMTPLLERDKTFYKDRETALEVRNALVHKFQNLVAMDISEIEDWAAGVVTTFEGIIRVKEGQVPLGERVLLPPAMKRALIGPDLKVLSKDAVLTLDSELMAQLKKIYLYWQKNPKIRACDIVGADSASKMLILWIVQLAKDFPYIRAGQRSFLERGRNKIAHDHDLLGTEDIFIRPEDLSEARVLSLVRNLVG